MIQKNNTYRISASPEPAGYVHRLSCSRHSWRMGKAPILNTPTAVRACGKGRQFRAWESFDAWSPQCLFHITLHRNYTKIVIIATYTAVRWTLESDSIEDWRLVMVSIPRDIIDAFV